MSIKALQAQIYHGPDKMRTGFLDKVAPHYF